VVALEKEEEANLLEKSLHLKKKHNLVVLRDIFEELSCAVLTIMN
jgi:hypothetical protein